MALSILGARWQPVEIDTRAVVRATHDGWVPAAARCLVARGFDAGPHWLAPSLEHLHDPYDMDAMAAAVERLTRAAREGQRVRIITDYDVDGTTSSLILQAALRLCSRTVILDYHIPDRFTEGYGFSVQAAEKAAAEGIDLIVTADIGVRDHAAVAAAIAGGVDVLICDHHLPAGADVPEGAVVLCPPKADCNYPNPSLAACGVSMKVAQALLHEHPKRELLLHSLLKLAAIGTIADLVPLNTLENRAIVSLGLDQLNHGRHTAGLQALLDVCDIKPGQVREEDISFRLAPRINAAGRIATATSVVELLTTRDPGIAKQRAEQLDQWNQERKAVQSRLVDASLAATAALDDPFIVVSGPEHEGWHRGVVGIVASRLKDERHRPVAVVSIQGDKAVGSVRSVPGVHAVRALESASDLLEKFGGHPAAAGFTVPTVLLDALRERLCAWMTDNVHDDALIPEETFDAAVDAEDLSEQLLAQLTKLGPFGMGNPAPRLAVVNTEVRGPRTLGKDKRHLKWTLARGQIEAIWWGGAPYLDTLTAGRVDLLGSLSVNVWRGRRTLQFIVRDARASAGHA